jgi:hypothetical protein
VDGITATRGVRVTVVSEDVAFSNTVVGTGYVNRAFATVKTTVLCLSDTLADNVERREDLIHFYHTCVRKYMIHISGDEPPRDQRSRNMKTGEAV